MPLARLTKEITFNLNERGYQHNGHSQSHVDVSALVEKINSPQVQELVKNSVLYGYYGHEVRQVYGINPPETAIIGGKVIRLEPCCRTVKIHAKPDGTVTHQQEFLTNDAGEHAYINYKANIGGFSHSFRSIQQANGTLKPIIFAGMDYTRTPNFTGNLCYGAMADTFNSLLEGQTIFDVNPMVAALLEQRIVETYNSIEADLLAQNLLLAQEEVQRLQVENNNLKKRHKEKLMRQVQRQEDVHNSLLYPVRPFDDVLAEAEQFLAAKVSNERQSSQSPIEIEQERTRQFGSLLGRF